MALNPSISDLDQQQIMQRSFDGTSDRIRVDAELSASIIAPPGLEVSIQAADDNIAIRNSNNSNELLINLDGSINTNATQAGSWTIAVSNFPAILDTNYGTSSANTLRTASQIGNSTGQADFNAGANTAQTLRVSANLSDGAGTLLTSTLFNSKQSLDVRPNPGFSTGSNTRPTVTITSSTILASNVDRKYASVFNGSGAVIYIKFGATAVVNEGYRLANNELLEVTGDKLWTGSITAIRGAGSGAIEVFEGTI